MNRMWAIVERELRKFFRSPALMLVAMVFPLVQLIVLGNAFGGKIKDARLGVVDQDHGTQAVKVREALAAVAVQRAHIYSGALRQRPAGDGRRAHRTHRRRHHYSAGILAARLRAEPSAHRADRGQHRQLHELDAGAGVQRPDQGAEQSRRRTVAHRAADHARHGGALSLHRVHEVSAARLDRAGHVRLGHDRRRHVVHRRQGARRARRLPGHADHEVRAGGRAEHRRRDQGDPGGHCDHRTGFAAGRAGDRLHAAKHASTFC